MVVFLSADRRQHEKSILRHGCRVIHCSCQCKKTRQSQPQLQVPRPRRDRGLSELALPIEVADKKIVIRHLLVVSPTVVVKHRREEWICENPVIRRYQGDKTWIKDSVAASQVRGKWTHTVWEVSDEPRYQGFSQFMALDDRIFWQNTTNAPLPRREYSVGNDYNLIKRTNRLNFFDSGYVHEQDNQKLVRQNGLISYW